jgi:hypothetical protein
VCTTDTIGAGVATTPWARCKTRQFEPFGVDFKEGSLYVYVGDLAGGATCRLTRHNEIQTMGPGDDQPRTARPFRVNVNRWTGSGVPCVNLHPLAIAHLVGTRQVPTEVMRRIIEMVREPAAYASCPVTTSCPILDMLGVSRAVVAFDSTSDLVVTLPRV